MNKLNVKLGWHPIESAPKDGTRILFDDDINPINICWYETTCDGSGWTSDLCKDFGGFEEPLFWHPIPTRK